MKYVWIVMVAGAYLIWTVCSIIDIVHTYKDFRFKYAFNHLEEFSSVWLSFHIFAIFVYSLAMWIINHNM